MRRIGTKAWRWLRDSRAVSALEYAILVGVISVAIALAVGTFGGNLTTAISNIGTDINATTGAGTPQTTAPTPSPN